MHYSFIFIISSDKHKPYPVILFIYLFIFSFGHGGGAGLGSRWGHYCYCTLTPLLLKSRGRFSHSLNTLGLRNFIKTPAKKKSQLTLLIIRGISSQSDSILSPSVTGQWRAASSFCQKSVAARHPLVKRLEVLCLCTDGRNHLWIIHAFKMVSFIPSVHSKLHLWWALREKRFPPIFSRQNTSKPWVKWGTKRLKFYILCPWPCV